MKYYLNYILYNCLIIIIAIFLISLNTYNASAAKKVLFVKTIITDTQISAYINTETANCKAMLGTTPCEIISYEQAENLPSDTLILVDTSGSIPKAVQDKTSEFLSELIDGKIENERYAIASFGTDITYLCDYTSDRYELSKAVEKLDYSEKYTYIYSTMDNVLKNIGEDVFMKIIVISDGVENSKDGITYDEILRTVSNTNCPIYTIGIENNNQENLKKFYSFSRNSAAESFTLTSDTDVSEVCGIVNECRYYTCITIDIPDGLADGSIKYLKISGENFECGVDIHMQVIAEEKVETSISETYPSIETTQEDTKVSISEKADGKTSTIIICSVAVVAIIAVIIIILIVKSKKDKSKLNEAAIIDPGSVPTKITPPSTLIGDHTVKLTDINAQEHSYRCALGQGVIVGRDPKQCMVALDYDDYISRRHIKIFCENGKFYVENLSEKQGAVLNDTIVLSKIGDLQESKPAEGTRILVQQKNNEPVIKTEISNGDTIKIGHTSLRIEIL